MLKGQYLATILTANAIALGTVAVFSEASFANSANISCKTDDGTPTIVASKGDGSAEDLTILKFMEKYFASSNDALQNCQTTANKLQTLYNNDSLYTLATDTMDDGQSVVCAVGGVGRCNSEDALVLFTLNNNENPSTALYNMLGSDFRPREKPDPRTISRIYTDIRPQRWSLPWLK